MLENAINSDQNHSQSFSFQQLTEITSHYAKNLKEFLSHEDTQRKAAIVGAASLALGAIAFTGAYAFMRSNLTIPEIILPEHIVTSTQCYLKQSALIEKSISWLDHLKMTPAQTAIVTGAAQTLLTKIDTYVQPLISPETLPIPALEPIPTVTQPPTTPTTTNLPIATPIPTTTHT